MTHATFKAVSAVRAQSSLAAFFSSSLSEKGSSHRSPKKDLTRSTKMHVSGTDVKSPLRLFLCLTFLQESELFA